MGRKKKRSAPDTQERIFCYYCDRNFHNEHELLSHQREKHLRCPTCNKRMLSVPSLMIHASQMHNVQLKSVPNAINGRDAPHLQVLGMENIPDDHLSPRRGQPQGGAKRNNNHSNSNVVSMTTGNTPYPQQQQQLQQQHAHAQYAPGMQMPMHANYAYPPTGAVQHGYPPYHQGAYQHAGAPPGLRVGAVVMPQAAYHHHQQQHHRQHQHHHNPNNLQMNPTWYPNMSPYYANPNGNPRVAHAYHTPYSNPNPNRTVIPAPQPQPQPQPKPVPASAPPSTTAPTAPTPTPTTHNKPVPASAGPQQSNKPSPTHSPPQLAAAGGDATTAVHPATTKNIADITSSRMAVAAVAAAAAVATPIESEIKATIFKANARPQRPPDNCTIVFDGTNVSPEENRAKLSRYQVES